MQLKEYIKQDYVNNLDYYKDTIGYADLEQSGWTRLNNVEIPDIDFIKSITNDERSDGHNDDNVYTYGKHDELDLWGKTTFPNIKFQDCRVQLQKPGDKVDPHVDTLIGHIQKWIDQDPAIGKLEHSIEHPNADLKAVRYFIGVQDHIPGQNFIINNKQWIWKSGDVISLNVWRGLHYTENKSNVDRYIIKLTGIEE